MRGVNVDGVVRTLTARGLIAEVGSEPSGAVLYGTTHQFLERMGLDDLSGLPDLAPFLPDAADLEEAAEQLVHAALWRGGRDNITVVLVGFPRP